MASRRHWHLSLVTAIAGAALLAACGGGDPGPTTTRIVSFGDSLSDLGTYTPASQIPLGQAVGVPPFFGGRFTTNTFTGYSAASNSNTATIWVEGVAARLGIALTQNQAGFGPVTASSPRVCPAALTSPALASSCTAYGQGGSRVTNPAGVNNPNGNGINGTSPAPMTLPVVTQVAHHLAQFNGFNGGDIVFVWAGANDALIQFSAAAGGLDPAIAVANMAQAGTELATLVRTQIVARGATRVVVMNVPDLAVTPGFASLPAPNRALATQLTAEFNTALATGLNGVDVRIFDARAFLTGAVANPATYGFTNVTTAACDPARMAAATGGSSLFCNASPASAFVSPVPNLNSLRTGASASTWLFADSVHPTTGGHRVLSDLMITQLKAYGWIPANI